MTNTAAAGQGEVKIVRECVCVCAQKPALGSGLGDAFPGVGHAAGERFHSVSASEMTDAVSALLVLEEYRLEVNSVRH